MLPVPPLDNLRQEIDQIDDQIHDLLMKRATVVERIKQAKAGGPAMRPGREAAILRRLAGRHAGDLAFASVDRIWREMIAALTRIQAPVTVAVFAPEGKRACWDSARDQYGSQTPMVSHQSAATVIRAVKEGSATVGVLPRPEDGEPDPWWPVLATGDRQTPRVIARLPFCTRSGSKGEGDALAIAQLQPEQTGEDCSLFTIEVDGEMSRSRLLAALQSAGLSALAVYGLPAGRGRGLHLVEVSDFVPETDERLAALAGRLDGSRPPIVIGAYARPLAPAPASA